MGNTDMIGLKWYYKVGDGTKYCGQAGAGVKMYTWNLDSHCELREILLDVSVLSTASELMN